MELTEYFNFDKLDVYVFVGDNVDEASEEMAEIGDFQYDVIDSVNYISVIKDLDVSKSTKLTLVEV